MFISFDMFLSKTKVYPFFVIYENCYFNLLLMKKNIYPGLISRYLNMEIWILRAFIVKGFPIRVICFEIEKKH